MTKCIIDFYGMPANITEPKVEIEIREGAKLRDIIAALRLKVPSLEGKVIVPGQDRMVEGFTFNIHGRFYIDGFDNREGLQLKEGDHIALLTVPVGG